ncbi:hypothetical protein, partial [Sphingopyxis sp. LC81]|uniref:hypothetical protein n=1 Tax=Sphingopyxis sp. LC81 TaxID=1502850 RepID=UPI001F3B4F61
MTTHENTRSRRSDILAHHRSSQRAAISTPQQLPARRPSGHGYFLVFDLLINLVPTDPFAIVPKGSLVIGKFLHGRTLAAIGEQLLSLKM